MTEKTQKILLAVAVLGLLLAVGLIFFQQRTISSLRKMAFPSEALPSDSDQALEDMKPKQANYLSEAAKNDLVSSTQEIVGKVLEAKDGSILVEAEIVDLEKIPYAESLEIAAFAKMKKNFSVAVNGQTEFFSAKLQDVKPGGKVQVLTNDLVYKTDKITATAINYPYVADSETGEKFVRGTIKEIKDGFVAVSSSSEDGKEKGLFSVKILKETKIVKKDFSSNPPKETTVVVGDMKIGDNVTVLAADPIGNRQEFEAVGVDVIVSAPPQR